MDETYCTYVGSFALLKSATHKSLTPVSDFGGLDPAWYSNLTPHSILHVCSPALTEFVRKVLPSIQVPFKLLTNNSDATIPNDYQSEADIILNNPLLEKWFAQNCIGNHSKLVRIPIGVDYHSMRPPPQVRFNWQKASPRIEAEKKHTWGLRKHAIQQEQQLLYFKNSAKPFWERDVRAYGNFQFSMNNIYNKYGKTDRPDAIQKVPKELVFYEPYKATRDVCWKHMIECAFVLSPWGNGLDCHRTWEALALGCIPIMRSSGLDPLFDDLPVWIVSDWSDVSLETMKHKIEEFKGKTFKYEKLTLAYWRNILNA